MAGFTFVSTAMPAAIPEQVMLGAQNQSAEARSLALIQANLAQRRQALDEMRTRAAMRDADLNRELGALRLNWEVQQGRDKVAAQKQKDDLADRLSARTFYTGLEQKKFDNLKWIAEAGAQEWDGKTQPGAGQSVVTEPITGRRFIGDFRKHQDKVGEMTMLDRERVRTLLSEAGQTANQRDTLSRQRASLEREFAKFLADETPPTATGEGLMPPAFYQYRARRREYETRIAELRAREQAAEQRLQSIQEQYHGLLNPRAPAAGVPQAQGTMFYGPPTRAVGGRQGAMIYPAAPQAGVPTVGEPVRRPGYNEPQAVLPAVPAPAAEGSLTPRQQRLAAEALAILKGAKADAEGNPYTDTDRLAAAKILRDLEASRGQVR